ncbi:unnamed protein product [Caenorhabditis sp. 36 PRJEB53466]|nr:unnamed protein product [Caenorhabditis sp. 36 PRJEB53466]
MNTEIFRITDPETPWLELLVKFGFQNKPFILSSWSTQKWLARRDWIRADGSPSTEFLKAHYGNSKVPILIGGCNYETSTLNEYLETLGDPEMYLKDWHFQNEFGTSMYSLHPFFSRDFVNCETWTTDKSRNPFGDDYRFVYFGAAGSWTKFHSDVVSSHSWSANICGRKKWLMMPPGSENLFRSASSESGFVDDIRVSPELFEESGVLSFIQEPGEIVFVPSNWYHQVHNLTDTIPINHNWMNSTNLSLVYEFLSRRVKDVRHELRDCRGMFSEYEFEEQVELVLFADARLNMTKFEQLCELVRDSRVLAAQSFSCHTHGADIWHCILSPDCHASILSICSCSTDFCSKCFNFIQQLEFSVVSRYL